MSDAADIRRNARWALLVLWRQRVTFASVFLGVVAAVTIYTILMQPIFRAESKLLVTVNRAPLAVSPELNPRYQAVPQVREEDLNSVVSMLQGRELVKTALLGSEGSADDPASRSGSLVGSILRFPIDVFRSAYYGLHGQSRPTTLDRRVKDVAERIQISPIRRSNVVGVAFEDPNPDWAAQFLNRFVDGFLTSYARTMDPSKAESFFDEQSKLLADKLHESERLLKGFRERVGIVSLTDQRKGVVEALTEIAAERDTVQVDLEASKVRLAALDAALPKVRRIVPTGKREVHEATSQVRGHLMLLEVKRAELLQNYTEGSIKVGELDEQIAATKAALARAAADPTEEHEYGLNKTYETLAVEKAMVMARVEELKGRLQALTSKQEQLRDRALAFDSEAVDLERLERERELDEQIYTAYLQQREAARLSNALNRSQIVNVAVATPAATPVSPVRPKLRVNLMIGLLLGLFAGLLVAFLRDQSSGSIDYPEDVERNTGLDVVGVLPEGR